MEDNILETVLPDVAVVASNGHLSEVARPDSQTAYGLHNGSGNGTSETNVNGTNGSGITQRAGGDVTALRAALYGATGEGSASPALFWNAPLSGQDELNWFVPPLPHSASADAQVETMLEQFGGMMNDQPRRAWLLRWNYRTRSAASAAEQAHVEAEASTQLARLKSQAEREITRIDAETTRLNGQLQTLDTQFLAAQNQFAESAAKAGLHCEVTLPILEAAPARSRRRRNHANNGDAANEEQANDALLTDAPLGKINPQVVEDALNNAVPTLQEMAGEYGVGPVGHSDMLAKILSFFMQFLAPLVAGMMLALCLGTLVGILDIDTLQRSDSAPQLILSAALGFVIVYLMGELFHTAVATLARSLETRDPDLAAKPNVPRFRSNMGIALTLLVVALCLGAAEVTAEGLGIRQLHQQQITKQNRFRGAPAATGAAGSRTAGTAASPAAPASEELPLVVYLVIGTLISGPYLAYKTAKGWGENESYLREAWLTHRQRVWLDERRAQPDVQQAFHHAYSVEQIESNLTRTRLQLQNLEDQRERALNVELPANMQSRRREARAAAVGEAARLQQSLEELVNAHEPMPQSRPPIVRQAQAANRRASIGPRTSNS